MSSSLMISIAYWPEETELGTDHLTAPSLLRSLAIVKTVDKSVEVPDLRIKSTLSPPPVLFHSKTNASPAYKVAFSAGALKALGLAAKA